MTPAASVNASYINTYTTPVWPRVKGSIYSWTLFAFGLLDVVLLFWLFNPFSASAATHYRLTSDSSQIVEDYDSSANTDKPSPLGSVAVHKAKAPTPTHSRVAQANLR